MTGEQDGSLRQQLEALLFVADEPLGVDTLAELADAEPSAVDAALPELAAELRDHGHGVAVRHVGGGWRMYTAPEARGAVEAYALSGRSGRLTRAALETLAVIAYKQPISRRRVGEIRGVSADATVRTLQARELIEEIGREDSPGQAILYGTTTRMLERLGLESLDDLPELADFLPDESAPDEPAPGQHGAARQHLAEGRRLPSTGRSGWTEEDGAEGPLPPMGGVADGDDDDQMAALSDALERVARSAIDQLEAAEEATERAQDPDRDIPDLDTDPRDDGGTGETGDTGDDGAEDAGTEPVNAQTDAGGDDE